MSADNLEDGFTEEQIAAGERRAAYADLCATEGLGAVSSERQDLWSDPEYPDTWQEGYESFYGKLRAILLRKFKAIRKHTAIDNADEGAALALQRYRSAYLAGKPVHKIPLSLFVNHAFWHVLSGRTFVGCSGQRGKGRQDVYDGQTQLALDRNCPYRQRSYSVDFSLDFIAWTKQLTERQRQVALLLAIGNSTGEAAKAIGVSGAAISLMRRMLERLWIEWDRR